MTSFRFNYHIKAKSFKFPKIFIGDLPKEETDSHSKGRKEKEAKRV